MADRTVTVRLLAMVSQYQAAIAQAAASTKALGAAVKATNASTLAATSGLARAQGRAATGMGGTLRSMRGMLLGFGLPLGVAVMTKSWLDFERQMAHTGAVTSDAFGKSTVGQRRMREAALGTGAAFGFSATEVGKAQEELAKAGRSTVDILGGDLPAALTLAAAGTLGLDEAAKHIAVSMTQFASSGAMMGKEGINAAQVADLLAKSANATVSDVSSMATALSYVGPQAASLGMSMQETVTTIALLNQAGIDGDRAGTNLRGMLTGLMSPSHLARVEMEKLGLTVFDTNGQFIGMSKLAQELQDKLGGMTMAEQQNIIGRLTTNAAMPAFIILTKAGAAGWELMKRKIDASASAQDVAKAKLDSVTGSLAKFGATMNNSGIRMVENFSGPLKSTAEGLTKVATGFGNMGTGAQLATIAMVGQLFMGRKIADSLGRQAGGFNQVRTASTAAFRETTRLQQMQSRIGTGPGQIRPGWAAMSGYGAKVEEQARKVAAANKAMAEANKSAGFMARMFGTGFGAGAAGVGNASNRIGKAGAVIRGAMTGAGMAVRGLTSALGGIPGIAIMGGLLAFEHFSSKSAEQKGRINTLADSLVQLGATVRTTGSVASDQVVGLLAQDTALAKLTQRTSSYGISLLTVADATAGNEQAQKNVLENYDKQLGSMRQAATELERPEGALQGVQFQFRQIGETIGGLNPKYDTLIEKRVKAVDAAEDERKSLVKAFTQAKLMADIERDAKQVGLEDALGKVGSSSLEASEGVKAMALNLQQMNAESGKIEDVLKAGAANIDMMAASFNTLTDAQGAFRATTLGGDFQKALGTITEGKGKAAKPVAKVAPQVDFVTGQFNTRTIKGLQQHAAASAMAAKGFDLMKAAQQKAVLEIAPGFEKMGAGGIIAVQQFKNARDEFIATAHAAGMSTKAAASLADAYGLIPEKVETQIGAEGASKTLHELNSLGVQISNVNGEIVLSANTEPALRKILGVEAKIETDPITKQVKYVVPNEAELAKVLGQTTVAARPITIPLAPRLAGGGGIENWEQTLMRGVSTKEINVRAIMDELPKLPDAEVKVNPKPNPIPPFPRMSVDVTPHVMGRVFIPDATVNVRQNLIGPSIQKHSGPTERWGAVHTFATGGIHAKVGKGDLIRWAEPETGGEAYIPRKGNAGRSRSILEEAAGWYGLGVHKMAAGGIHGFADGGISSTTAPLGDFVSRYMAEPSGWMAERTTAMMAQRDAVFALRDAEAALREVRKDKKHTVLDLAKANAALADARRSVATANLQVSKAKMDVGTQFRAALDTGLRNTGSFIANLNTLAGRGYGTLAMQLLQMGGPEAERIAAAAVKWNKATAGAVNRRAGEAVQQQKVMENLPAMLAIRAAVAGGKSYGSLLGSGQFTGQEINSALALMEAELKKTEIGRAMLAAMHGNTEAALSAKIRGFASGGIAAPGSIYRYAEPSTGGEAVIPRFGSGATAVLAKAAAWHGLSLTELSNRRAQPAAPVQVQISVTGEGTLASMVEARVDGKLVQVTRAVARGRNVHM
jgi:TP901 family phage tail tape measure protein